MKVLEAQPYLSVECSGIISLILRYKLYNCAVDRGWMLLFVYYCLGNVETMLFFSVAQSFLTLCNPMDCSIQASDPISRSLPSSRPLHEWCYPAISSCAGLFCSPSFPASGTFPMNWLFASDDQNTGASPSASVLPKSIQGWFPLRLTGFIFLLISLLSRELSEVFSSTTVLRHHFFGTLLSLHKQ